MKIRLTQTQGLEVTPPIHDTTGRSKTELVCKATGLVILEALPQGVTSAVQEELELAH